MLTRSERLAARVRTRYPVARAGLLCVLSDEVHWVRVYESRLAIARHDGQRMTWEELQDVKQQVWGDSPAVEFYPPEHAVVNLRHTRHLWRYAGRLPEHPEFLR